jgi:NDP-sugar pyrophosphorylase family protein
MKIFYIFILSLILIFSFINIFIYIFNKKIIGLEKSIISLFEERSNLIPSLYEVTKKYLTKHDEVFFEILKLRKNNLSNYNKGFLERINEEVIVHHEISFIFKVANKHQKIQKDYKFLLIRDLFLENSNKI